MDGYRLKNTIAESKAQVLYIYGEKEMGCVKESAKLFNRVGLEGLQEKTKSIFVKSLIEEKIYMPVDL